MTTGQMDASARRIAPERLSCPGAISGASNRQGKITAQEKQRKYPAASGGFAGRVTSRRRPRRAKAIRKVGVLVPGVFKAVDEEEEEEEEENKEEMEEPRVRDGVCEDNSAVGAAEMLA